jgi:hypothetical protein
MRIEDPVGGGVVAAGAVVVAGGVADGVLIGFCGGVDCANAVVASEHKAIASIVFCFMGCSLWEWKKHALRGTRMGEKASTRNAHHLERTSAMGFQPIA